MDHQENTDKTSQSTVPILSKLKCTKMVQICFLLYQGTMVISANGGFCFGRDLLDP